MAWAPDYVTSAELKSFVRISDGDDDDQVALAVTAASRAVDRACNRQFGQSAAAEDRYYTAEWDALRLRWFIKIDDLMTTTDLAVSNDPADDGTYPDSITSYRLAPINAAADGRPWTDLIVKGIASTSLGFTEDAVRVHAIFGWTEVPDTIKEATLLQASRFLKRRDSPFGVAGSPDIGSEMRLLPKIDPDVALAVRPYYRWWGAV